MPSLPFQGGTISFLKLPWVYSSLSRAGPLYKSCLPNTSNKSLADNLVYSSGLLWCFLTVQWTTRCHRKRTPVELLGPLTSSWWPMQQVCCHRPVSSTSKTELLLPKRRDGARTLLCKAGTTATELGAAKITPPAQWVPLAPLFKGWAWSSQVGFAIIRERSTPGVSSLPGCKSSACLFCCQCRDFSISF